MHPYRGELRTVVVGGLKRAARSFWSQLQVGFALLSPVVLMAFPEHSTTHSPSTSPQHSPALLTPPQLNALPMARNSRRTSLNCKKKFWTTKAPGKFMENSLLRATKHKDTRGHMFSQDSSCLRKCCYCSSLKRFTFNTVEEAPLVPTTAWARDRHHFWLFQDCL